MKSMTGYGKGIAERDSRKVTVEMRAVNHRFLDLLFKLPKGLIFCEDTIRKICANYLVRGHVDVFCTYEDNREGKATVKVDSLVAEQYRAIGRRLEEEGFINDITVSQLLRLPEVIISESNEDDDEVILSLVAEASEQACQNLVKMRSTEGAMLMKDLLSKLDTLQAYVDEIALRAPSVSAEFADKLRQRVEESLKDVALDESRLLNEVAFYVDKVNIDEELTRLNGHIKHGRSLIKENGAVGKQLDFLVQELNREINTTGSKSNDLALTEIVLKSKNEIEKIREQVQNIE